LVYVYVAEIWRRCSTLPAPWSFLHCQRTLLFGAQDALFDFGDFLEHQAQAACDSLAAQRVAGCFEEHLPFNSMMFPFTCRVYFGDFPAMLIKEGAARVSLIT
jgi:hypothetical protein